TPGAPWRIRVNDQLRALFVEDAPTGYVPIVDAMRVLGVSRQTVLQRVKRGELKAIHVRSGRRKAYEYWPHKPKPLSSRPPP
ncbi:MAG: recombinase family protein, partial [Actinobacteria bacterium]|nr:recombinase family protein [Actinomycetota bacterium]